MRTLNQAIAERVAGGQQWGFLRQPIQIPDSPQPRPLPFPVVPILD